MKKGIVMEQHRKFTVMMTHDGLFEKAHPVKNAAIGFEVEYEPFEQKQWSSLFKGKFWTMRVISIATVFLLLLLPIYLTGNGNEAYAYVDIDINPSIELELDDDLEVSDVIAFNEDAVTLIDEIGELTGLEIDEAIELIIQNSEEKGFVNTAKNVLIGVHYVEGDEENPIQAIIEQHFTEKPTDWQVVTIQIPEEVRVTAEKNKQSMNEALAAKVTEQADEAVNAIVTEEDSKVLQSFYNSKKSDAEVTNEDVTDKNNNPKSPIAEEKSNNGKENSAKDEDHPSNLKGENGESNSNKPGKDKENSQNRGNQDDSKKNDKENKGNHKANQGKGKDKDLNEDHPGKQKGDNKDKHNDKQNENNNSHNKGQNKGNNGKDNKGNNGNNGQGKGNGNGNQDNYSLGIPTYK
ncbi:anti-sigma-I factor RsgI family protein [Ornithinibacillus californiensis]|uniref:anti-sigma-I factor RsgI family protein n=1 Tax=Ornithinibacillus californiensis TaxID=161536 RepID=UPI00069F79C8|nr:hypothetical protein [Ornithinibacillus californiensis]